MTPRENTMPTQPLSAEKLQHYADGLRAMRDRLLGEVDQVVESIREDINPSGNLSNAPVHLADAAPEQIDADINVIEAERGMLEDIQAAIHRIDEGTFGYCTDCGCQIAEERLQALPYTPYCVHCSSKHANFRS
jgi:DnaK suppressor protein